VLFDTEQLPEDNELKNVLFDVCICGAGPAGITLAFRLAARGWRVALLEAGALEINPASQDFYKGEIVGLDYYALDTARLRYLGGTSNHWVGETRPFDSEDFEPLENYVLREWPIRKTVLDRYEAETDAILDLPRPQPPPDIFRGNNNSLVPAEYRQSPPTRFREKYKDQLKANNKISLYLNANVTEIQLNSTLRSVTGVIARTYNRETPFEVRARQVVLCMGGLENPRALLNSNRQMTPGIGNEHDLVGRYFTEHPEAIVGWMIMASPLAGSPFYLSSGRLMSDRRCLKFRVGLTPKGINQSGDWCTTPFMELLGKILLKRAPVCFDALVEVSIEQALNRDSRVVLSDQRDRFGLRRLALDWRLTELDYHTIKTAAMEIGRCVAVYNVGRMQLAPWLTHTTRQIKGQFHHMCTTRMSDEPRTGVVDRNCRVHGTDNLHVGGSSIFSNGGVSNPTYTVVQLALRLGDHLDALLRKQ
jgi:choline dehydrogenase-like flavoprotein